MSPDSILHLFNDTSFRHAVSVRHPMEAVQQLLELINDRLVSLFEDHGRDHIFIKCCVRFCVISHCSNTLAHAIYKEEKARVDFLFCLLCRNEKDYNDHVVKLLHPFKSILPQSNNPRVWMMFVTYYVACCSLLSIDALPVWRIFVHTVFKSNPYRCIDFFEGLLLVKSLASLPVPVTRLENIVHCGFDQCFSAAYRSSINSITWHETETLLQNFVSIGYNVQYSKNRLLWSILGAIPYWQDVTSSVCIYLRDYLIRVDVSDLLPRLIEKTLQYGVAMSPPWLPEFMISCLHCCMRIKMYRYLPVFIEQVIKAQSGICYESGWIRGIITTALRSYRDAGMNTYIPVLLESTLYTLSDTISSDNLVWLETFVSDCLCICDDAGVVKCIKALNRLGSDKRQIALTLFNSVSAQGYARMANAQYSTAHTSDEGLQALYAWVTKVPNTNDLHQTIWHWVSLHLRPTENKFPVYLLLDTRSIGDSHKSAWTAMIEPVTRFRVQMECIHGVTTFGEHFLEPNINVPRESMLYIHSLGVIDDSCWSSMLSRYPGVVLAVDESSSSDPCSGYAKFYSPLRTAMPQAVCVIVFRTHEAAMSSLKRFADAGMGPEIFVVKEAVRMAVYVYHRDANSRLDPSNISTWKGLWHVLCCMSDLTCSIDYLREDTMLPQVLCSMVALLQGTAINENEDFFRDRCLRMAIVSIKMFSQIVMERFGCEANRAHSFIWHLLIVLSHSTDSFMLPQNVVEYMRQNMYSDLVTPSTINLLAMACYVMRCNEDNVISLDAFLMIRNSMHRLNEFDVNDLASILLYRNSSVDGYVNVSMTIVDIILDMAIKNQVDGKALNIAFCIMSKIRVCSHILRDFVNGIKMGSIQLQKRDQMNLLQKVRIMSTHTEGPDHGIVCDLMTVLDEQPHNYTPSLSRRDRINDSDSIRGSASVLDVVCNLIPIHS